MDDKQILEELQISEGDLQELKQHFCLQGLLGTGSYGVVFRAIHLETENTIAVKVSHDLRSLTGKIIKRNKMSEKE